MKAQLIRLNTTYAEFPGHFFCLKALVAGCISDTAYAEVSRLLLLLENLSHRLGHSEESEDSEDHYPEFRNSRGEIFQC